MCEFCENKKPLEAKLFQKFCTIESYVVEMKDNNLIYSALVQGENGNPFSAYMKTKCNFCPMCGRKLIEAERMSDLSERISKDSDEKNEIPEATLDFPKIPITPIEAANYLIKHTTHCEAAFCFPERDVNTFSVEELEQIAEHLLVYCKHNEEENE